MGLITTNNALSTLAAAISVGTTTLTVQAADAAKFPTPAAGDWFPVTLVDGVNLEIVRCTARAGAVLTVARGQEGTAARAFPIGARVSHRLTSNAISVLLQDPPADGKQYARKNGAWDAVLVVAIGDNPPASPAIGQLWWESDTGNLFIWYDDGNSVQWVPTNVGALPEGGSGGSGGSGILFSDGILLGGGPPGTDIGELGDVYLDTETGIFYGPRAGVSTASVFGASLPNTFTGLGQNYEVGTLFTAVKTGYIIGVRWYRQLSENTRTSRNITLWSGAGANLHRELIGGEPTDANQWVVKTFATPQPVTAGASYAVSYDCVGEGVAHSLNFHTALMSTPAFNFPPNAGCYSPTPLAYPGTGTSNGYYIEPIFSLTPVPEEGWPVAVDLVTQDELSSSGGGGGGIADAPNDANAYVRSGLAWVVGYTKAAIDTLLGAFVAKTGDTMTGNLGVSPTAGPASVTVTSANSNAFHYLDKGISGATNAIVGRKAFSQRWRLELGDGTAEAGSDAGSDFTVRHYNDSGGSLGVPFQINRATGLAIVKGDPTALLGIVTKQYADAGLATKAATVHTHAQADVTNLVTDLAGKAPTVHTHAQSDVTGLVAALAAKLDASAYTAADVLTKIKTVDGAGSGLDAELVGGKKFTVASTAPSSPATGDVWIDTT
jgi:hypothetical protein